MRVFTVKFKLEANFSHGVGDVCYENIGDVQHPRVGLFRGLV